jgi:hypothetical protein
MTFMKKNPQIFLALTIAVALLVVSCRKTNDPAPGPTPVGTDKSELNNLFKAFRSSPEIKCVTAGTSQTVVFSKGTKLTFYPNSFETATGATITSGTVCLEVIEMYKPGEMIANRATTTYNNQLLKSGGQVHIKATQNGVEVFANKYGIGFRQPGATMQPMRLFYGDTNNEDSVTTWTTDTIVFDKGSFTEMATFDTSGSAASNAWYFQFDSCTDFKWINCDYFTNNTDPRTNITIKPSDTTFNRTNTTIYMVFPVFNAVAGAYSNTDKYLFTGYNFPIGLNMKVVMLSNKNGEYYYEEQTGLTVAANMTITTTPTKQSLEYIKEKMKDL